MLAVAKAPDVIPSQSTNRALRLISGVIIHFREQFVMQLWNLAADHRQQRLALQPSRTFDIEQGADGRIEIQMRDHRIRNATARELAGASQDESHACPV